MVALPCPVMTELEASAVPAEIQRLQDSIDKQHERLLQVVDLSLAALNGLMMIEPFEIAEQNVPSETVARKFSSLNQNATNEQQSLFIPTRQERPVVAAS